MNPATVPIPTGPEPTGKVLEAAARSAGRPAGDPMPGAPRRKRVLLADDDSGIRQMLGRVLESEHYEVMTAQDGNEAARCCVAGLPDLVLLDLNMPERDGWSAFRFMDAFRPRLAVIVITARPNQYARAREQRVDAFMEKPLNLPALLAAMKGLLAESESERNLRLSGGDFETMFLGRTTPPPAQ